MKNGKSFLRCMSVGLIAAGAVCVAVSCSGVKDGKQAKVMRKLNSAIDSVTDALGI